MIVEIKEVTKTYSDSIVLREVNLRIEDGEFVSIIGPSGSGKTTLLNVIAGLLTPSSGHVVIDGISLYHLSRYDRVAFRRNNFGFVFQTFNLVSYLTARENVEVPLYLEKVDNKRQRSLADGLLERVGLKDKGSSLPYQLSVGERQRVAIARTLANSANIVFADEPTGNLDRKNGYEVMGYFKELNKKGVTVLLVTHDPEMAGFADREIELVDGRLL